MPAVAQPASSGRPAQLDRERIIDAAVRLLEADGDFSMRALGRELGVNQAAIYHWFANRDALMRAVLQRTEGFEPPTLEGNAPLDERLIQWCVAWRNYLERRASLIATGGNPLWSHWEDQGFYAAVLEHEEHQLRTLVNAGLNAERAHLLLTTLMHICHATATQRADLARAGVLGTERPNQAELKKHYPLLAHCYQRAGAPYHDESHFQWAVRSQIDLLLAAAPTTEFGK